MKVLQVQEADDKQTWVLKAPGEQVMADFPHTVEGHTDAVYVCDCVNNYEKAMMALAATADFLEERGLSAAEHELRLIIQTCGKGTNASTVT